MEIIKAKDEKNLITSISSYYKKRKFIIKIAESLIAIALKQLFDSMNNRNSTKFKRRESS